MSLTAAQFAKLMTRLARAWSDNDTPMALAYFTEDALYIEPPDLQLHRGHNQLRLFFNDLTAGTRMEWHNLWFDEATQRGAGEYSFSLGGWENKASHGVAVVELRNGLIAHWREYQRCGPADFAQFIEEPDKERQHSAQSIETDESAYLHNVGDGLNQLKAIVERLPAIQDVATGGTDEASWWVKFSIDIRSPHAWNVVQELAHVLNYLALDERLLTLFMPVSPPPYLNGGPDEFLHWVIESRSPGADPGMIAAVLQNRLPDPDDKAEWMPATEDAEE